MVTSKKSFYIMRNNFAMKKLPFLLALLLGLAACTPAAAVPTSTAVPATATPVLYLTDTPTPTNSETPTATPTPEVSPTPEHPPYTPGLAKTMDEIPDIGSLDKLMTLAAYLSSPEQMQRPVVSSNWKAGFDLEEPPDVSRAVFSCNYHESNTCTVLATARIGNHLYIIVQISTDNGPKNLTLYLGSTNTQYEDSFSKTDLERLQSENGFTLDVITRIKTSDYDNPLALGLAVVGIDEPLPDSSVQLEKGVITDEQEVTLMWGGVTP
jgi:hypothetical protein